MGGGALGGGVVGSSPLDVLKAVRQKRLDSDTESVGGDSQGWESDGDPHPVGQPTFQPEADAAPTFQPAADPVPTLQAVDPVTTLQAVDPEPVAVITDPEEAELVRPPSLTAQFSRPKIQRGKRKPSRRKMKEAAAGASDPLDLAPTPAPEPVPVPEPVAHVAPEPELVPEPAPVAVKVAATIPSIPPPRRTAVDSDEEEDDDDEDWGEPDEVEQNDSPPQKMATLVNTAPVAKASTPKAPVAKASTPKAAKKEIVKPSTPKAASQSHILTLRPFFVNMACK